jgi:hypothetical protein
VTERLKAVTVDLQTLKKSGINSSAPPGDTPRRPQ